MKKFLLLLNETKGEADMKAIELTTIVNDLLNKQEKKDKIKEFVINFINEKTQKDLPKYKVVEDEYISFGRLVNTDEIILLNTKLIDFFKEYNGDVLDSTYLTYENEFYNCGGNPIETYLYDEVIEVLNGEITKQGISDGTLEITVNNEIYNVPVEDGRVDEDTFDTYTFYWEVLDDVDFKIKSVTFNLRDMIEFPEVYLPYTDLENSTLADSTNEFYSEILKKNDVGEEEILNDDGEINIELKEWMKKYLERKESKGFSASDIIEAAIKEYFKDDVEGINETIRECKEKMIIEPKNLN